MALFKKKTGEASEADTSKLTNAEAQDVGDEAEVDDGPITPVQSEPDKAARFFEHAKTSHEAGNYEYAMQLWLRGMSFDPSDMNALESFFKAAAAFLRSGKKGVSKETTKVLDGKGPTNKFTLALLQWGIKPESASSAVRATDLSSKLGLPETTYWLGERAVNAVIRDKRPSVSRLKTLVASFGRVGAYDKAVETLGLAAQLDPNDSSLQNDMRNLAAQAAMSSGGYEDSDKEGGFRKNIRNLDEQRAMEEADKLTKTEDSLDRLVGMTASKYQENPDDLPAATNYAKRLIERGTEEDEANAFRVLSRAYEQSKEFRFRQMAGDLKLKRARRKLSDYRTAAEAPNASDQEKLYYAKAQRKYVEMEAEEFQLRVEAYSSDLTLKYELGKRYVELSQWNDAIPLFQASQRDPKVRISSMMLLGRCFFEIDWLDEAIQAFEEANENHKSTTDELSTEIRYNLLIALQKKASDTRDVNVAERADKIASSIALQQFDYRDIRERRNVIKALIKDLRAA
ncbi:MAG: hypothetical protein H6815_10195 [Phycisphaeraceae bacterium]|nr:hypothetical protein [Phycisphaerales bacterium]MCB9860809.1 hypothetical protein [Phycisphaeraceae bacterium]